MATNTLLFRRILPEGARVCRTEQWGTRAAPFMMRQCACIIAVSLIEEKRGDSSKAVVCISRRGHFCADGVGSEVGGWKVEVRKEWQERNALSIFFPPYMIPWNARSAAWVTVCLSRIYSACSPFYHARNRNFSAKE